MVLRMIEGCFDHIYIVFKEVVYQQIQGTAMGSPLSQILSALVVDDIMERARSELDFEMPLLETYVDDFLVAVQVLECFNRQNGSVQFTMEVERGNELPYLDMIVVRVDV